MDIAIFLLGVANFFKNFLISPFFLTVKFLLAIYITVLFADMVMLVILRGFGDIRTQLKGMNLPLVSVKKMRKKWEKIKNRLSLEQESQYKLAIIEADQIVDKIVSSMGLKGKDMIERLESSQMGKIEYSEELKKAHQFRNKIIHDESAKVSKETAKEIVGIYEEFLNQLELL